MKVDPVWIWGIITWVGALWLDVSASFRRGGGGC